MNKNIYIESHCPTGEYYCIIEGDDTVVWMYLHDIKNGVIADSPICSLKELINISEFKKLYKRGDPPPLVREYSNDSAVIPDMTNERLDILWHIDGVSPLAIIDNEPFSMIIHGEKKGYSKAITVDGPWGHPWDKELYFRMKG